MAATYQVNINIIAGIAFTQQYTVANSDLSPADLTGFTLSANLAKHSGAVNAVTSTSSDPVWKLCPFTVEMTDPTTGQYTINLTQEVSSKLKEGKYVYSVIMTDLENITTEIVGGLAFVNRVVGGHTTGTIDSEY